MILISCKAQVVNGDEFIQPLDLQYNSYYSYHDEDTSVIDSRVKDTLFFTYDNKYISADVEITPHKFYLVDGSPPNNGTFFFEKINAIDDLNAKRILSLKKFIRSSQFYDKNKKPKLNDYKLWLYFNGYVIFLIKKDHKKTKYIEVKSFFIIE